MKILILSDTHRRVERLSRVLAMHADADFACFLGDGLNDLAAASRVFPAPIYEVCGNCDSASLCPTAPGTRIVEREGHRLFLTHGHLYGAKWGQGGLVAAAKDAGCDIVLYGHTHLPQETYLSDENMYLFNPGSLGEPREGEPSYGLLLLDGKNVLFSHGTLPR